jgi:hypothetical protein
LPLGNLETQCREIIEYTYDDYENMMRRTNGYGQQDDNANGQDR